MKPYKDIKNSNNIFERTFESTIDERELVWHRDKRDRKIKVLESDGWLFQRDNELPFEMNEGDVFEIKKGVYHRIIKGDSPLRIKIIEHN